MFRILLLLALAIGCALRPAHAAESYDNCTGFIQTLPATITTQGVWCLAEDKATSIAGGAAINIAANNVTLDCNGFKLGGLAAGAGTEATGVYSVSRSNVTVRNCSIRGFAYGTYITGNGGHVVEDNRLDGNTYVGILVSSDGYRIDRNTLSATGGSTVYSFAVGIAAYGSGAIIRDNIVNAVAGNENVFTYAQGVGLEVAAANSVVSGNHVSGVRSAADNTVIGIASSGAYNKLIDNTVSALSSPSGSRRGLNCTGDPSAIAVRNVVSGASSPVYSVYACMDGGGNLSH